MAVLPLVKKPSREVDTPRDFGKGFGKGFDKSLPAPRNKTAVKNKRLP
jgi:hypothetical protein